MTIHFLPLAEYCILQVRWSLVMGWPLGGGGCTTVWPIIATLKCNRTHFDVGYINMTQCNIIGMPQIPGRLPYFYKTKTIGLFV